MKKVVGCILALSIILVLHGAAVAQDVDAFGLTHSSLGSAALTLDPIDNLLIVNNIGSSGIDGVSIDVGETEGRLTTFQFEAPLWEPVDVMTVMALGQKGGTPGQPLMGLQTQGHATGLEITPDFSPLGATTHTTNLFLNDSLVFSQSGMSGPAFRTPYITDVTISDNIKPGAFNPVQWTIALPGPGPLTIPGGPTILADRVTLVPDSPTQTADHQERTIIRALSDPNIPQFTIIDEALFLSEGRPVRALGQAMLEAGGDTLTVSNIGSSGEDGVSIDFEHPPEPGRPIGRAHIEFEPIDLSASGARVKVHFPWLPDGASAVGEGGLFNNGGTLEAFADFLPLGTNDVLVEVFNGSALVGSGITGRGTVATIAAVGAGPLPRLIGHDTLIVSNIGSSGLDGVAFDSSFDIFAEISIPGGGTFIGDRFRTGSVAGERVGSITDVALRFSTVEGGTSITITGMNAEPAVPEPAGLGLIGMALLAIRKKRK